MALTEGAVIKIVLSKIGGSPLMQSGSVFAEGKKVAQKLGGAPSLKKLVGEALTGGGMGALMQNPLNSALTVIQSQIGTVLPTQLSSLVASGAITGGNLSAITSSLSTLSTATSALSAHSNLLAGITDAVDLDLPHLDGILSQASVLSSLTDLPGNTVNQACSALFSGDTMDSIQSYVSNIPAALASGTPVATVLADLASHTSTMNGIVSSDIAGFASLTDTITTATKVASLADNVLNNTEEGAQGILSLVVPDSVRETLSA